MMIKKTLCAALAVLITVYTLGAEAANTAASGHYDIVTPEGFSPSASLADGLNGLWDSFNAVFGFDPDPTRHRLKVTILADRAAFDGVCERTRRGNKKPVYFSEVHKERTFGIGAVSVWQRNRLRGLCGPGLEPAAVFAISV